MQKLNIRAFSLALGFVCGIYFLILGWVGAFGWGDRLVEVFSSFYIGYESSFIGGIIGGIWAFFDGAIGGLLFSWLYNVLSGKLRR